MSEITYKKIAIAADHAGFELKKYLIENLKNHCEIVDLGTGNNESVDYPDFANKLANFLKKNPDYKGILLCGTGIGISIAANRHQHIRAALCCNEEMAILSRKHNDANVLSLGARIIEKNAALSMSKLFLSEKFEENRHQNRVDKL